MSKTGVSIARQGSDGAATRRAVHIVDDEAEFRDNLAELVTPLGVETLCYRSAEHFLSEYRPRPVECLVSDLRLPGASALGLQRMLIERNVLIQVIVISGFGATPDVVAAMQRGAADFLDKPVDEARLLAAVGDALDAAEQRLRECTTREAALQRLSKREREVLDLLVDARTTIEAANLLGISPKTVEKHRAKIFEKTGVGSVPELIRLVIG
ncbi:Transcriptional regulatory protein FixJ [Posidoniimonas corsicana]|uniref:Transcriptional regulatory protein FixJ n=1 Tax=Posidoniimonas corsicana TaxID=1938618 RepID=A0A5C5VIT7_9BACT|nr:response regulator [Posidoniimonas corsicana]TWT37830.1 Transcriptional regulatory protein FixJ [Posidoniimonas corsicana]